MPEFEEILEQAAKNPDGSLGYVRVQSPGGQWYVMPASPDGGPLTFWTSPNESTDESAFRDDAGHVLAGVVRFRNGSMTVSPLDASLRPLISVVSIVAGERVESANPGGWPLTDEELDAAEPPDITEGLPDWHRNAVKDVARDDLGQFLTTRVRAADGGWADVLMTTAGTPLCFEQDQSVMLGKPPSGDVKTFSMMRGLGGWVAVTLDDDGQPTRSGASLREQKP